MENNKTLAGVLKELGGKRTDAGGTQTGGQGGASNPKGDKCNIYKMMHQNPMKDPFVAGIWSAMPTNGRLLIRYQGYGRGRGQ